MQRKYLAVAILCAGASVGHAQSTVTLYGVVDANLEFANHLGAVPVAANGFNPGPSNNVFRMDSGGVSGSRWGLRGSEGLGGGLKAVFVLESGFNLDTGTSPRTART